MLFLLSTALAISSIFLPTTNALMQCEQTVNGKFYNLTSLKALGDIKVTPLMGNYDYYINVCGAVQASPCSSKGSVFSCQVRKNPIDQFEAVNAYSDVDNHPPAPTWGLSASETGGVKLQFLNGDLCNLRQRVLNVDFQCDYNGTRTITIDESPACTYNIIYPTKVVCAEPAPTTEAPTTKAPTTEAPTTKAPTTEAPTTKAPTTEAPTHAPNATTAVPTTEAPTTHPNTTAAPTTEAPTHSPNTTAVPTTEAPTHSPNTTAVPTTEAPTTHPNTTAVPTEAPTHSPNTTVVPTEAPTHSPNTTTAVPTTEAPTTLPTTAAPTDAPTTHAPTSTPAASSSTYNDDTITRAGLGAGIGIGFGCLAFIWLLWCCYDRRRVQQQVQMDSAYAPLTTSSV